MGFEIKRISIESKTDFNRGADLVVKKGSEIFLVEIKAYREDYSITKREFNQLNKYMKQMDVTRSIFITTSKTSKCPLKNVIYVNGESLVSLLKKYDLANEIKFIKWIQTSRVNRRESLSYKNRMKNKIINYVRSQKHIPSKKEIQEHLNLDIRTYFGVEKPYEKLKEELGMENS